MNFSELKLNRPILRAVEEQGYRYPSPIQEKAIPPVLDGYDLLGCAQTGTGKTAAFALPILQRLAASHPNHKGVRALILTPTRELALQIDDCFAKYGKYLNVSHTVIFGGVGQNPQIEALQRGADVLTACPGRLNDLIGQGHVDLSHLEVFVLDEADRMLDMGFVHDVKKVLRYLPARRQNLLFSATMPREIEELAATILKRPVNVKVNPPASTVDRIDQSVYKVEKADKKRLLALLLAQPDVKNALVFSRTKHGANAIAAFLQKQGVGAAAIHGNKSQSARVKALEDFKSGTIKALIATDIAARGIDINSLSHVFQLDLPEVAETYVHRIGRTGRAGAEGTAVSFCCPDEEEYLADIEKLIRKKIPVKKTPALPERPAEPNKKIPAAEDSEIKKGKLECLKNDNSAPQSGTEMEDAEMAENKKESAENLSASAKRRRRRRRAAAREEQAGTAVKASEKQPKQQPRQPKAQKPQKQEKQPREERGEKQSKAARQQKNQPAKRAENAGRPAKNQGTQPRETAKQPKNPTAAQKNQNVPAKNQPNRAAKQPQQPIRQKPQKQNAPVRKSPAAKRTVINDDPGLTLISRRPPAQKFASFEEFLQSRGLGDPVVDNSDEN